MASSTPSLLVSIFLLAGYDSFDENEEIGLWEAKCALMRCLGINVPLVEIQPFCNDEYSNNNNNDNNNNNNSSSSRSSGTSSSSNKKKMARRYYLRKSEFEALFSHVMTKRGITESTLQRKVYTEALDRADKGFVVREDLQNAFARIDKRRVAGSSACAMFDALDELQIGKISTTQVTNKIMRK